MVPRSRLVLRLLALSIAGCAAAAEARPARPAPALPAPSGAIVNVSTEAQLQAAARSLSSNTTIVLAPGTYVLTRTLYIKGVNNVGIRGATTNADDVVLVGPGMSQASYGDVPFGIWAGDGVNGITIANLTIRDLYFHPIIFNAGAENPHVYNVHLIDAGEQFIKSNPDDAGGGVDNGIVEYSVLEFTTTGRSDYPKGVDIQTAQNWVVRHNVFKNFVPPGGGWLSGPAVLAWRGATNTTVEGNLFLNCTRGVMFGVDDYYSPSHRGGVIRNNIVVRSAGQPGDVGIMLTSSPDTQVVNNTVYLSGTYPSPIEYRYGITSNVLIANNLVDGTIAARDGATATLRTNQQGVGPGYFTSVAGGDLHLSALAGGAIDQGTTLTAVTDDWDGQARPQGAAYDIGADERAASTVTYRVGGRITDPSGTPLSGVTLTLSGGQSRLATSDAAGAYAFTGLAAGPAYTVTPAGSGLAFTPPNQYVAALAQDQNGTDFVGVALPSGSASAAFVRSDTSTAGTWMGSYGADGSVIAGGATATPSYATVAISSASSWTWAASTGDARAPQKPAGDRVAACWYAGGSFTIDVDLTDGQSHQVALYLLDWDGWGRSLRADVVDAATGAVLDTRQASGFQGGQYLVWSLKGHVLLRLVNAGPQNAVASALLFGAAGGTVTQPSGATAAFTRTDDTTGGNWNEAYGTDGYAIAGAASSYPSYAQVSFASALSWTWASSTADPRAPRHPSGSDRIAATWYSSSAFTIDVNLTDGRAHQVALYLLDFDTWGRSLRADVLDASSGAVLDTRLASGLQSGRYLVWSLSGHVVLRLTNTGPQNAVASALLFGGAGATTPPGSGTSATFARSDDTTKGSWLGAYGSKGYALATDAALLPAWAPTSIAGASTYSWFASTNDARAVQRPDGNSRLAACWYADNALTVDMDLRDGASHTVALYMLDWDPWGRAQRVEVLDAATGAVLDNRSLSAFSGGRYLVWTVKGHVVFRVVNAGYPNAVLNGVFVD